MRAGTVPAGPPELCPGLQAVPGRAVPHHRGSVPEPDPVGSGAHTARQGPAGLHGPPVLFPGALLRCPDLLGVFQRICRDLGFAEPDLDQVRPRGGLDGEVFGKPCVPFWTSLAPLCSRTR